MRLASLLDKDIEQPGFIIERIDYKECFDKVEFAEKYACIYEKLKKFDGVVFPEKFDTEKILLFYYTITKKKLKMKIYIFKDKELQEFIPPIRFYHKYIILSKKENYIYVVDDANTVDLLGRITYLGEITGKMLEKLKKYRLFVFFKWHPDTGLPAGIQPLWKYSDLLIPGNVKYKVFNTDELELIDRIPEEEYNLSELKKRYKVKEAFETNKNEIRKTFEIFGGIDFYKVRKLSEERLVFEKDKKRYMDCFTKLKKEGKEFNISLFCLYRLHLINEFLPKFGIPSEELEEVADYILNDENIKEMEFRGEKLTKFLEGFVKK